MLKLKSVVAAAGVVVALPLMGSSAWSQVACPAGGSQATYQGFGATGCTVQSAAGPLLFSNIQIVSNTGQGGTISGITIDPFGIGGPETGLTLTYAAQANSPNAFADVDWRYTVTSLNPAAPIIDAFLEVAGGATGTAKELTSEVLDPGGPLFLDGPGIVTANLAPAFVIQAVKDNDNIGPGPGGAGAAFTSSLTNAFSPVPAPLAGAGLPGLIAALGGLVAMARRRRKQLA